MEGKYLGVVWKTRVICKSQGVTPQKYPRIFIIILLYIQGVNRVKLGSFRENL